MQRREGHEQKKMAAGAAGSCDDPDGRHPAGNGLLHHLSRAKGGYTVYRDATTTIDEQYEDWVKYVTITSVDGEPVFVRARAYTGSEFSLHYEGENWSDGGDGWWYYALPLEKGQSAAVLKVYIDEVPINPENDLGFDVAVVYESTVALYKPDGSAYAKFDEVLDQGG